MICALLTSLAALQAPASQLALHPGAPLVYLEFPDVGRTLDAYGGAPLVQMLRDEQVRAAFAKLESALELDLGAALDEVFARFPTPAGGGSSGIDNLLAYARTARAASLSVSLTESAPGELAACVGRRTRTYEELAAIEDALFEHARAHDGSVPPTIADLRLAAELMSDAWDKPYEYARDDDGQHYALSSLGADGTVGGVGEAADISGATTLDEWLGAELTRRMALLVAVEFTSSAPAGDAVRALADAAPDDAGAAPREILFRGAPARVAPFHVREPWDRTGWTLQSDALVVCGLGAADPTAFTARVDAATAVSTVAAQLAALDVLAGPAQGAPVVRAVLQTSDLDALLELAPSFAVGPARVLDVFGGSARRTLRMQLVGERFVTDWTAVGGSSDSWTNVLGSAPVSKEILAFVPDDAAGVLVTQLDGQRLFEQVLRMLGAASGADSASTQATLAELERKHGFDLRADLFGSLAGPAAAYVLPLTGLGLPNVALVLDLKDATAFQRGLRGLAAVLGEQGQKVKESKYRDAPLWTLAMGEEAGAGLPFLQVSPTIVVIGQRAIVAQTSLRAKKEVKRALGEEIGKPHPLLALERPPPADASVVGYMDWATMVDSVYLAAKGALALFGGMAGAELPVDIGALGAALPESATTFTRFFKPTTLWSRPIPGGSFGRYEASFGPETWTSLGLGPTLVVPSLLAHYERAAEARSALESESAAPTSGASDAQATRATLAFFATRITVFKFDQGRYPAELAELCRPTPNYPRGFVDSDALPGDAWGRAFEYERTAAGDAFRVWSRGADGVDAHGADDDIVAP